MLAESQPLALAWSVAAWMQSTSRFKIIFIVDRFQNQPNGNGQRRTDAPEALYMRASFTLSQSHTLCAPKIAYEAADYLRLIFCKVLASHYQECSTNVGLASM